MGATFANSTNLPPPPPPHLLDFEMNLSTPIPNHTHTHTHTHARTHAQRVWKNTLQNLQYFLLKANENDKGLLDTTHIIIISR